MLQKVSGYSQSFRYWNCISAIAIFTRGLGLFYSKESTLKTFLDYSACLTFLVEAYKNDEPLITHRSKLASFLSSIAVAASSLSDVFCIYGSIYALSCLKHKDSCNPKRLQRVKKTRHTRKSIPWAAKLELHSKAICFMPCTNKNLVNSIFCAKWPIVYVFTVVDTFFSFVVNFEEKLPQNRLQ